MTCHLAQQCWLAFLETFVADDLRVACKLHVWDDFVEKGGVCSRFASHLGSIWH